MAQDAPKGGYSQYQDPDEFDDDAWTALAEAHNAAHAAYLDDRTDQIAKAIYREASANILRGREARQAAQGRERVNVAAGYDADGNPTAA